MVLPQQQMGRERVIRGQIEWAGRHGSQALCCFIAGLLCLFHISPAFSSSLPLQEERLEYRVSYQGALSARAQVDICDAVLETSLEQSPVNGEPAVISTSVLPSSCPAWFVSATCASVGMKRLEKNC